MTLKYASVILVLSCLAVLFTICHCHGGHHGHSHDEAPSFKYSRAANEKDDHHGHSHGQHKATHENKREATADSNLWIHAMGSTLLISAAPFVILFFVPLDNSKQKKPLLNILLAFAAGGLLGDAFLHLIPHATMSVEGENSHSHSHSHGGDEEGHSNDMRVGLLVLAGS